MKKIVAFIFKLIYLILSLFVIMYNCTGAINVALFCVSIFIYTGSTTFDALFCIFESEQRNSQLKDFIRFCSYLTFSANFLISVFSLVCTGLIDIIKNPLTSVYEIIIKNTDYNGLLILFPSLVNWKISLVQFLVFIGFIGISSLIPAIFLEYDSYIEIKNKKEDNTNT